jgi:hypothetical protein
MGVMIARACDSVNNEGGDVAGYDRHDDATFSHMTTWAQQADGGYGWQPNNCGQSGVCNTGGPRESFDAGNYIVQTKYNPSLTPKANGGGAPAPPTPAPATTPTTAKKATKSTTRAAAPRVTTPAAATPAPTTAAAPSTTVAETPTTAAAETTTTASPQEAALSVPSEPTGHRSSGPGALAFVALAVLAAAAAGSIFARRRTRRG